MTNENSYLQQIDQQFKIIKSKISRSRLKSSKTQATAKFKIVTAQLNDLRQTTGTEFETKKVNFETVMNELSQMVTDNSKLGHTTR